ncbi:hypothetical protein [Rhizobium leguminosarum]|uniref:hypothetical protein n=1 Tax=Rhizobium leguminosarum TaxID=384 RepID=UPI0003FB9B98|nr:hypothetical protein [Rhizobium leguminosarum]
MSADIDSKAVQQRVQALSDFALIATVERWVRYCEEHLDPQQFAGIVGGVPSRDLENMIADVRRADRSLNHLRSVVVARLILVSALADPTWRNAVLAVLDAPDDQLKAGAALRFGTVGIALLLLSVSLQGDTATPNGASFSESTVCGVVAQALSQEESSPQPDPEDLRIWDALKWLTSVLNASEITALINAVELWGFGATGVAILLKIRKKAGTMYLVLPDGREVEIPPDKQASVERLIAVPNKSRRK